MRSYFTLQGRMINRQFIDFGLHPVWGYVLLALVFVGFTAYLFLNADIAQYAYALMALSLCGLMSESGRVGFLKQHFSPGDFQKIRGIENTLVVLPFVAGLIYYGEWLLATAVLLLGALLSLASVDRKISFTLPTPYSRYPFEFATGFRRNYLILVFAGFLLLMAVLNKNPNLGLFSVALVMLVSLIYYLQTETTYLVWIHAMTPAGFLLHKISIALFYTALTALPFSLAFLYFFTGHGEYLAIIIGLGLVYIVAAIVGKYAFFPASLNLPQGLVLALSYWFPPMLLFMIPYFYIRSVKQLKPILE